jgi:hypothetical protein
MPTSREMAQRYAAASRRKKRRDGGPRVVIRPAEDAGETVEDADATGVTTVTTEPQPRDLSSAPRVTRSRGPARRTLPEYIQDYSYIARDLRRVAMVAGGLLVLLLVLAFVLH